jgi:hypothetical protein
MRRSTSSAFFVYQHGAALLIFMLFIFLVATSWILGQSGGTNARNQRDKVTATAMAQAKEALIGRAATDDNRPGSLPCPNINGDGTVPLFAGTQCPSYIGRFPWKTLGLPEPLDGNGDGLWYALSPGSRDNLAAQPINPQKPLELTLDGTPNIAAIIFSPGPPLANQNGRPSNAVADYLDGSNNDGDYTFVSGPPSATFNDKVLAITRENLFNVVNRRILREIRGDVLTGLVKSYADNGNNYPWAAADALGVPSAGQLGPYLPYTALVLPSETTTPPMFSSNNWYSLIAYNVNVSRQQVILTINTPTPISCKITPGQPQCQ